jgi:hypothetical protein
MGEGFVKSYILENGLTACVNNYHLNNNLQLTRHPTHDFGVIIYLYSYEAKDAIEYKINDKAFQLENGHHHMLRVISSQTMQQIKFGKGTAIRGVSIFLENEWIRKNIKHPLQDVFFYLKEVNFFKEFINARQHRLLNEIIDMPHNHPFEAIYVKSRVYRIVNKLLQSFLHRDISESPEGISEEDFKTLQHIETILTDNYGETFPGH